MTDTEGFVTRIMEQHPELAARILEQQSAGAGKDLLAELPAELAAAILSRMVSRAATARLRLLAAEQLAGIFARLSPTTAAGLLRSLPKLEIDTLLSCTPEHLAKPVRYLLHYPETVIGAWMKAAPFLLPWDVDAGAALELTRAGATDLDRQLFVVDRQQRLQGAVAAASLLRQAPGHALRDLMYKAPFALPSRTELRAAADHPGWQQWDPLPVINRERRVVGLLHHAELRRALSTAAQAGSTQRHVSGSLMELLDLSWHGLADVLEAALRESSGHTDKVVAGTQDV